MKKKTYLIISIIWILSLITSFQIGVFFQWASTAELKVAKDYIEITVDEGEIIDYSVFLDIPPKYMALEQIEEPLRKTISLYMEANNLKLSEGVHSFRKDNGTLDEYLNEDFKFETIE